MVSKIVRLGFIILTSISLLFSYPVEHADAKSNKPFSFVWMSDTQYYSLRYPYIYDSMTQWIVDHADEESLKYVIHTGDIVDHMSNEFEWIQADLAMKKLDQAKIPYGVLAGNHDIGHDRANYQTFSHYFGVDRFKSKKTFVEAYKDNEAHYDILSIGGHKFIILHIGYGWTDETINWAKDALESHSNHTAILATHRYLQVDGKRSGDGNELFEKLVKPYSNVQLVLSGHFHGTAQKFDRLDDNGDGINERLVVQLLSDYQGYQKGGNGFMRILTFNPNTNSVTIGTYSPYTNESLLENEDFHKAPMSFSFPMQF